MEVKVGLEVDASLMDGDVGPVGPAVNPDRTAGGLQHQNQGGKNVIVLEETIET